MAVACFLPNFTSWRTAHRPDSYTWRSPLKPCLLPAKAGSSISFAFVSAMDEYALLVECVVSILPRVLLPCTPYGHVVADGHIAGAHAPSVHERKVQAAGPKRCALTESADRVP
jgi:hypothetical protein